jgi:hypothetical protein
VCNVSSTHKSFMPLGGIIRGPFGQDSRHQCNFLGERFASTHKFSAAVP